MDLGVGRGKKEGPTLLPRRPLRIDCDDAAVGVNNELAMKAITFKCEDEKT